MNEFNPSRLRLARERRRLSSKELASRCEATPQSVSNWENGSVPSDESLAALSKELDFPVAFFFGPDPEQLPEGAATFRGRSKIPAREKSSALAAGVLARELAAWIEERFDLPEVNIPDVRGSRPQVAAQVVRTEWMLGERPARNIIPLLESRGVLVFSLAQDCHEIDAFSFWAGTRPVILLNLMKSPDRSRLDAAHELAHLALHREITGKAEESEADAFAGSFLMPKGDVYREIPRVQGLNQLIRAKRRWGVSLAALIYRLHELKLLTDWQYRSLFIEISKRGFRKNEPDPLSLETSTVLPQVFKSLRSKGVTPRTVAKELRWHPPQLNELIFGLGATLLPVGG